MRSCPGTYYIIVLEDTELVKIVACGTLFVEQKFMHEIAIVCIYLIVFISSSWTSIKRAVSRQSSSFCLILPVTRPQLPENFNKVSKEITCKWQNQRSEANKYVSWALFLKLQAAGINFEKLLGWTVFKNPNFNPFQSSSVLPIRGICCFCYVILTFL